MQPLFRQTLQQALRQMEIASLERQHVAEYEQYPVKPGEFDVWQDGQVWEEDL